MNKNNLYKKDVKKFISIFVKKLDIADYEEVRSKIEKYLKTNKINCIVTSPEKIVYAYGKKVEQYLDYEISDFLKDLANNENFGGMRSSNLEIVNGTRLKDVFYCEPLKSFKKLGCIALIYNQKDSEAAYNFLTKFM